ncbi:MAG TPA: hypothetical protein V6C90_09325 [Coleofasciculaceae cyanobacterium]
MIVDSVDPGNPTSNPVQHQRQMQMQRSHFSVAEDSGRTASFTRYYLAPDLSNS